MDSNSLPGPSGGVDGDVCWADACVLAEGRLADGSDGRSHG